MTDGVLEAILEIADENNIEIEEVRNDYSGRFMFGQNTNAIIVTNSDEKGVLQHAYNKTHKDKIVLKIDSMGMDYVIY